MAGNGRRKQRGNGEGTIYRDGTTGKWVAKVRLKVGDKLVQRRRSADTRADAREKLKQLQAELHSVSAEALQFTVGSFLTHWMAVQKPRWKASTLDSYSRVCDNWIRPHLGSVRLSRLGPRDIDQALQRWSELAGQRTQQYAHKVLKMALQQAVRWRMLHANPCDAVEAPRADRRKIEPFTPAECRQILEHVAGSEYAAAFSLAFGCGLRGCEIWGLQWSDVDWQRGRLHIRREVLEVSGRRSLAPPKSKHSLREVALPESVVTDLLDRRKLCLASGQTGDLIFTTRHGALMSRGGWRKWRWQPTLKALGIKHRGFHHARHTYATLALAAGVPVADVAKSLGHHSPAVTWSFYAHVLPDREREVVDAVSAAIKGA